MMIVQVRRDHAGLLPVQRRIGRRHRREFRAEGLVDRLGCVDGLVGDKVPVETA